MIEQNKQVIRRMVNEVMNGGKLDLQHYSSRGVSGGRGGMPAAPTVSTRPDLGKPYRQLRPQGLGILWTTCG